MAGLGEALRTGRLVVVSFQDISGTSLSSPHSHVSDASGAADGVATCAGQPECAKDGKLVQKNGSSVSFVTYTVSQLLVEGHRGEVFHL